MLFNSPGFCVFFIVVTLLYYLLPWSGRWKLLLLSSCYFYMSFVPAYILILLVTIVIDYAMAILIAESSGARRKTYLTISIVSTCAVLVLEGMAAKWWLGKGPLQTQLRRVVTLALILIGWVFFRAETTGQAFGILGRIARSTSLSIGSIQEAILFATGDSSALPAMAALTILTGGMFVLEGMQEREALIFDRRFASSTTWRAAAAVLLVQVVLFFGVLRASSFIYFQF